MFNQTVNSTTLDQLLDSLGFVKWKTIILSFILPFINVIGIIFCAFSTHRFFRHKFLDPVFFYYRLLSIVYIIHLIHNIPYGVLCSPRYFPQLFTHLSSSYLIYYSVISSILFHFEDVLQMAILLTRMKLFNLFVEKHFTFSPQSVSLTLFLICSIVNFPLTFGFKIRTYETYLDSTLHQHKFFFVDSSEFISTLFGQILFGFTTLFLNLILSMIFGIGLNVFALVKFKSHVREKMREVCRLTQSSIHNRLTTSLEIQQFNQRMRNERKREKNMFYMMFTLCFISILSRILNIFQYFYFFFFYNNSSSYDLSLGIVYLLKQTLVPMASIFASLRLIISIDKK